MKNFKPIDVKCCGTCADLRQDEMTGHFHCGQEEDSKIPVEDWTVSFDPQDGGQYQYVCDTWVDSSDSNCVLEENK